jgi:putative MATE family efflux protein
MEKEASKNLLKGNLKINLLKMSLPTMFGFVLQSVYDIVDMMWVGRISSSAVAGVTIFSTIFWLVEVLNQIIGSSSVSLISQSYGSGDDEKTCITIEQTLTFKALVAVIAGVILLILLKPLLNFFSNDETVIKSALDYGYIRIFFLPIMFSSFTVNTALRCLGDSMKPMITMGTAAVMNIVLDPIFIFDVIPGTSIHGLNLGVFGAALATVISTLTAFSVGFFILMSGRTKVKPSFRGLLKLNWPIDKKLLRIGLPNGVQSLMRNVSNVIILKLVSFYGTTTVAAVGIGTKLFGFAYMPLVGFAMGSSAIIGQCLGADDIKRAKSTARFATFIDITLMIIISIVAFIFPKQILKAFIKDASVITIGIPMLRIITPALICASVTMGLGSVFSGSGHNIPFLISSIVSRWCVQVPLLFIMVVLLKVPVIYVWTSFVASEFVEMIVIFTYYKMGTWEKRRV